jgi:hypothetical protein
MTKFLELLQEMIELAGDQFEEMAGVEVMTFADAGLLTGNKGLVVDFPGGTQYQVTVTLSKSGPREMEACPGCGGLPGMGPTPGCDDPDGCGFWNGRR